QLVSLHADEFRREIAAVVARLRHRVLHRLGPMSQSEFDALAQNRTELALNFQWNIPPQNITPQRQRQPRPIFPSFAEINQFCETRMRVSELPFVNDQAGVSTPAPHRLTALVERHDDVIEFTEITFQSQERARHRAGPRTQTIA